MPIKVPVKIEKDQKKKKKEKNLKDRTLRSLGLKNHIAVFLNKHFPSWSIRVINYVNYTIQKRNEKNKTISYIKITSAICELIHL